MEEKFKKISEVAKIVSLILKTLKKKIKIGTSGKVLNELAWEIMKENKVFSSSFHYHGFPSYICVSVSNKVKSELTHGIPDETLFEKGDLVSLDVACYIIFQGKTYHADAALTTIVAPEEDSIADQEKMRLLEVTRNSLEEAIKKIIPGITTNQEIGRIIQNYVEKNGFFVIKEYGGHGIGSELHELPFIPNHGEHLEPVVIIKPESFICIEPLVQEFDNKIKKKKIKLEDNKKWSVVISANGFLNAHFEHTVYISSNKAIVLTDY